MDVVLKVLSAAAGVAGIAWFVWWRWTRSQADAGSWLARASASGLILFAVVAFILPMCSGIGALFAVPALAGCMMVLGILWRHEITGVFVDPIGDLIDGGNEEIEAKPFYARTEAARMAGDIPGAIAAVRAELEKFPADFESRMKLAALLAEHSEDLPGALAVIEDTLALKTLTAGQVAYALNTAADWHIKFARNPEAAQRCVERIITLLAGTDAALHAQQRLANLPTPELLAREDHRQPIAIPEFERKLGLKRRKHATPAKVDINAEERRLRDRLVRHPHDFVAREELARLYVEQFEFFERGLQELEILITTPGQPKQEIVRWLHQKAGWQVKFLNDVVAGRATLKRIQELYPNSAFAERAAMAMLYLQPAAKFEKKKAGEEFPGLKEEDSA
ncbi:MAG: hypothetical protein ACKODH_11595 [Limisphaerales bacterium]